MKTKKAQSEIITTVLIILLVLAAVVIVWQVVQGTVKKGGEAITAGSACIGLSLNIDTAANNTATSVKIRYTRGADNLGAISSVKILVVDSITGATYCSGSDLINLAGSLEQKEAILTGCPTAFVKGIKYIAKIAPLMEKNQCDVADSMEFTA